MLSDYLRTNTKLRFRGCQPDVTVLIGLHKLGNGIIVQVKHIHIWYLLVDCDNCDSFGSVIDFIYKSYNPSSTMKILYELLEGYDGWMTCNLCPF